MKTDPTSLLRVVVVLAMLGSGAFALQSEQKSEQKSEQSSAQSSVQKSESKAEASATGTGNSKTKVVIEVNGKKVEHEGGSGTITIRTDGDQIEIDTDGDGKAEEHIDKGDADEADDANKEKVAWLGVKTGDISPELASQLDIEGGAVVEMVVPGSPADEGGLQEHDIINAIGETEISTAEELATAIRALKPGTETTVSALRKAKPIELNVTLGERPQMPKRIPEFGEVPEFDIRGKNADEIRKQLEEALKRMGGDFPNIPMPENGADIVRMSSKTTSFSNNDGSITITTKDGETQLVAKDAEGKLLYKGPAETDDDRKALPPKVLEMLEHFESLNVKFDMKGFKDKMRPPAIELPELLKPKPAKPKKSTNSKRAALSAA